MSGRRAREVRRIKALMRRRQRERIAERRGERGPMAPAMEWDFTLHLGNATQGQRIAQPPRHPPPLTMAEVQRLHDAIFDTYDIAPETSNG